MAAPRNIGVLIPRLNAEGLVPLNQKPEIESNEWGVRQMERTYAILNSSYPALEPAFGDAPVNPGDMDLSFLGKHSARFTRNVHSPGIGQLAVIYRGAVFASGGDDATTDVYLSTSAQKDALTTGYYAYDGGATPPGYRLQTNIFVNYMAVNVHYQYVARTKPTAPRFVSSLVGGSFTAVAATDVLTGPALANGTAVHVGTSGALPAPLSAAAADVYYVRDSTGTTYKLAATLGGAAIDLTTAGTGTQFIYQLYAVDALHPGPIITNVSANNAYALTGLVLGAAVPVPADYADTLLIIPSLSEFTHTPCGNYWEIVETGTVKFVPYLPSPLAGYVP